MPTETKTQDLENYLLPSLRPKSQLDNLYFDELGKEVLALHNQRFKGKRRIVDLTQYQENQPISYSNVPRILSYNQILREVFPNLRIKVLGLEEILKHCNSIPERDETYADTDSITIYPNQGVNEDLRQLVFKIIGRNDTKIPLIVSSLAVDPSDNNYGFTFRGTDYKRVLEAPFLTKSQRIKYDHKTQEIVPSDDNEGVMIYVPADQSGLRRLYRNGSGLIAWNGSLLNSFSDGRVQLVQDPQGLAKNFEAKLTL